MAKLANNDDEVAALYRLPPGEFTAARNALAKKLGPAAGDVRTLEKPQAAAWAVNQLYWQRRAAYDALMRAAQAVRTAHTNMLSGRKADVPQAEGAHRDAMRSATQAIREVAHAAGEALSAGTMDAVAETLRSLPSDAPPGRLTKPLQPLGFGALLNIEVQAPARRGADREGGASRKEAAENAKQGKVLEKALKAAEAAEREAEAALADARKAVAKVGRDYEAVRDRLTFLEKQRSDAEQEAHKRARELQNAANARIQAAQDLQRIT